jgi:hypothetical protein
LVELYVQRGSLLMGDHSRVYTNLRILGSILM